MTLSLSFACVDMCVSRIFFPSCCGLAQIWGKFVVVCHAIMKNCNCNGTKIFQAKNDVPVMKIYLFAVDLN